MPVSPATATEKGEQERNHDNPCEEAGDSPCGAGVRSQEGVAFQGLGGKKESAMNPSVRETDLINYFAIILQY